MKEFKTYFIGKIFIAFGEGYNFIEINGIIEGEGDEQRSGGDFDERISALESWKETIDDWKDTITDTLTDLVLTLTGHTTSIEDHEDRIISLESSGSSGGGGGGSSENGTGAGTWDNFKNYIGSSIQKKMVCGYAEENRLESIEDLGYSCDLTYKTYSSGRERVSCRCSRTD